MDNQRTTDNAVIHFKSGKTLEINYIYCKFYKENNVMLYTTQDCKAFHIELNTVEYIEFVYNPDTIKETYL